MFVRIVTTIPSFRNVVETGNLREEQMEAYPTSLSSRATADMVNDFYESRRFQSTILQSFASTTVLQGRGNGGSLVNDEESDMGGGDENSHASSAKKHDICPNSHAVMCCWGRDRQSNDDNGNCKASDCDDADPADNTNLYVELRQLCLLQRRVHGEYLTFTCYMEYVFYRCMTEDEGDIHCHGLAWSSDPNHISAVFKFNNLFYVTLYDHWYKRGYVENSLGSSFDETGVSMCGCVDEMPMVTRADCTQVNSADITFTIEWVKENGLVLEAGTLASIELDECQGYEFGNPKRKENNDLASHVNSMVAEGRLPREAQALIFETLVGYGQPNNNDNDEACALALARQERGKQSQESETEESRSELVESTTMEKRGPALQIVLSIIICLAIVAGVIMAAKSERVCTLLSGRKGDGNDHVEYESAVDENSF